MAERAGGSDRTVIAVRARLFGEFGLEVDGEIVEAALTGKARSVLQYLLVTGRPVHREVLMELFWPAFDASRARNNLNVTMNALRRALGPAGHTIVVLRRGCYGIGPGVSVGTDVSAFGEMLQSARASDRAGDGALALRDYEEAVSCYGGDLVAEDPYSEWLEAPRAFHRAAHLDALKNIARLALQLDRPADATQACMTALLEDSLDEDVVELLLTSYLAREQRWQVSKAFADYRRRLDRHLRVRPSARLDRLVQRALA